jgi:hypothetical protein
MREIFIGDGIPLAFSPGFASKNALVLVMLKPKRTTRAMPNPLKSYP